MKRWYLVRVDRAGYADVPELARCETPEAAAAIVVALLNSGDLSIGRVTVEVSQLANC